MDVCHPKDGAGSTEVGTSRGGVILKICGEFMENRPAATSPMKPPMKPVMIMKLDGTTGRLTVTPLTVDQWWAMRPEDRPEEYVFHGETGLYFVASFQPHGRREPGR
jgi:hypothetical protein